MNVSVILEQRFERTPDGAVWSRVGFPHQFWTRYLSVFDHVQVVARIQDVASVPAGLNRSDGPHVSFAAIPYYVGPKQYLARRRAVGAALLAAVDDPRGAIVLRAPSQLASVAMPLLLREKRAYGVEVVGDPWDVFAPGAVDHPLRRVFRWWLTRQLRRMCAHAAAVAYVTRGALQERYPAAPRAFTTHYSSIQLDDDAFVAAPRQARTDGRRRVVTVMSLEQMYKAPDILIRSVGECIARGIDMELEIIGDGRHRPELEALSAELALNRRVTFAGQLASAAAVRTHLDAADLFVLPSRTEGLPRALIEAMARGLPSIGSSVGGIPELLPSEDMVPPNDVPALTESMAAVLADGARQQEMSRRNLDAARQYHSSILGERRRQFYNALRLATSSR